MANSATRYTQSAAPRLPDMVDRLFRESFVLPTFWDRTSSDMAHPSLPVNLFETPESYVLHAALPGLKPDNLDIQVVGREVSIKGRFEVSTPENGQWIWQGIPSGEFRESYTLPVEVDSENTQASYDYGILTIALPKAEHSRPKTIKVTSTK